MTDDDMKLGPTHVARNLTPRQRDEIWRRSVVLEAAQHAVATIDNEARPEALRAYARTVFEQCSQILKYQNDPEKRFVLVPLSLRVKDFYRDLWVDFLMRLPEEVVEDDPALIVMGGMAADLADDTSFSTEFRCESLSAFKLLFEALEVEAQQHLSAVE